MTGFPKEEAPPGEGPLVGFRGLLGPRKPGSYLQELGTYLARIVPAAAAPMPWPAAVSFEVEAQAQSMLPDRPVATGAAAPAAFLMNGVSNSVLAPASCGMPAA